MFRNVVELSTRAMPRSIQSISERTDCTEKQRIECKLRMFSNRRLNENACPALVTRHTHLLRDNRFSILFSSKMNDTRKWAGFKQITIFFFSLVLAYRFHFGQEIAARKWYGHTPSTPQQNYHIQRDILVYTFAKCILCSYT